MSEDLWQIHRDYRRRPLASTVGLDKLQPEEADFIKTYGTWMQALADSEIPPLTAAQARFVRVANRQARPETLFETVWIKYMRLTKLRPTRETVMERVSANEYCVSQLAQLLDGGGDQLGLSAQDLDVIRRKLQQTADEQRITYEPSVVFSTTDGQ